MTPEDLARVHAAAFLTERPWSAQSFQELTQSPHVQIFAQPHGFALTRTLAGESELLTLAVDPAHQRQGLARALMTEWLGFAKPVAQTAFLDVAADNLPACALYASFDFEQTGLRRGYYARKDGVFADALLMSRPLT